MKTIAVTSFITWIFLSAGASFGQAVKVNISGMRNTSGSIRLVFYQDAKSFENEKPSMIKIVPKSKMSSGVISVTYSGLKAGVYGIAVLDDENNNQKMDYGLILPNEGFGFSDYFHKGMSRPTFDQFDFTLKSETKVVEVKLRYL